MHLLLFLPLYLLNLDTTTFLPWSEMIGQDLNTILARLLTSRSNLDLFRVNLEITLLFAMWINVGWLRRSVVRWGFIALYLVTLLYYTYEGITLSIFQSDPIFYNHFYWALDGISFLLQHMHLSMLVYGLGGVAFVLAIVGVVRLLNTSLVYIPTELLSYGSRIGMAAIAGLTLISLVTFRSALASPQMVVSSLAYKLEHNVAQSLKVYRDVQRFDDHLIRQAYDYADLTLAHKPNIYLLFIESYGSVLYKRPDYRIAYIDLLQELEQTLTASGWHATSNLSVSPTWGGGSWMAYTSALFGLRIDTHPQYLSLFEKYQVRDYPYLGNYLRTQGYQNYRLSSLSHELPEKRWQKYINFYDTDGWIRYADLGYVGAEYGWGPSPPDQYALSFAKEEIQAASDDPFLLFFITQNSHYPYAPLPPLMKNWRTLNRVQDDPGGVDDETLAHETRRQNYFNSIDYELRFLTHFILEHGAETGAHAVDSDALFILVGDHQPPRVSRRDDGFETPIHIISRDPKLVAAFQGYGFVEGLDVPDDVATVKHEGFYSMLVRALVGTYGVAPTAIPAYLPDGFVVEEEQALE